MTINCYGNTNRDPNPVEEIILGYVCPSLGVLFANYQNIAPLKDLHTAVMKGQGLNGLNPTPWVFMLGTTIAWTAYALLSDDYFLFFADCFGFLSAVWLNLGAVKLMYSDHHQTHTRKTLVRYLQKNDKEVEEHKKSIMEQNKKEMAEMRRTLIREQLEIPSDDDMDDMDVIKEKDEGEKENGDNGSDDGEDSEERTSMGAPTGKKRRDKSSVVRYSTMLPRRSTALKMDGGLDTEPRQSQVRFSTFAPRLSTSISSNGEDAEQRSSMGDRERTSYPDSSRSSSQSSRRPSRRLSSMFSRRLSLVKTGSGSSLQRRREKVNHWADVVWKVTAQQEPAGAEHETLLVGCIAFWLLVFTILFFYSYHDPRENKNCIPLDVVGYIGIGFQLFFYGAPLARINHVLKTRKCDCIHLQSLIGNTLNNALWTGYGLAPTIMDYKIWGPCAAGLVFCAIQFFLCAVFPRSTESEKVAKRFSITSLLVPSTEFHVQPTVRPSSTLGRDNISDALNVIREYEDSSVLSLNDLESNTGIEEEDDMQPDEYLSSFGRKSYLY